MHCAGGGGIESLLLRMIALKDSNFSLLSYVADLNAEVDKTEGQITALTAELDQYRGTGASAADARRQNQEVWRLHGSLGSSCLAPMLCTASGDVRLPSDELKLADADLHYTEQPDFQLARRAQPARGQPCFCERQQARET